VNAGASVDVLIVSYNTAGVLRDCLRSIERHCPPQIELTASVLDNGSRDGSPDMVAREFPAVRLVRSQENLGFGRASNYLAETSSADYLLLLNSDTVWPQDIVTPLRAALEADPCAIVVGPRLVWPGGGTQLSSQSFPNLPLSLAHLLDGVGVQAVHDIVRRAQQADLVESREPRETDSVWATCWLLRRADVEREGLFDPRYAMYDEDLDFYEDLDFCLRARKRGRTVLYHPGVELVHIGAASSDTRRRQDRMWTARHRFYRDHHGRAAAAAYRGLILGARLARGVSERRGARR